MSDIIIEGAKAHNLCNIDVLIPRGGAGLIQQLAWSYELNNFIAQFATNDVFRQQILNMSHTHSLPLFL